MIVPMSLLVIQGPPRVEKYRPVTLDEVVSHKDIVTTSMSASFGCL